MEKLKLLTFRNILICLVSSVNLKLISGATLLYPNFSGSQLHETMATIGDLNGKPIYATIKMTQNTGIEKVLNKKPAEYSLLKQHDKGIEEKIKNINHKTNTYNDLSLDRKKRFLDRADRTRQAISNRSYSGQSNFYSRYRQRSSLTQSRQEFHFVQSTTYPVDGRPREKVIVVTLPKLERNVPERKLQKLYTTTIPNTDPTTKLKIAVLEVYFFAEREHDLSKVVLRIVRRRNGRNYIVAQGKYQGSREITNDEQGPNRSRRLLRKGYIGKYRFIITDVLQEVGQGVENSTDMTLGLRRLLSGWRLPNLKLAAICRKRRQPIRCSEKGISMSNYPKLLLYTQIPNNSRYDVNLR